MGRYVPKTYRNHRGLRIILRLLISVILITVILFVTLFFGLKKYIVYGSEGLRLEIPFLMEDTQPD